MNSQELVDRITSDRSHGATELALLAIDGLAELARAGAGDPDGLRRILATLLPRLQSCRPSMVALHNLLQRIRDGLADSPGGQPGDYPNRVVALCRQVSSQARQAQTEAVLHMLALVQPGDVVMTHSVSSTIKLLCSKLAETRAGIRLIATESRPGYEGRLLAAYARDLGLPVTFITEAQVDLLVQEADKVIVGADSVLPDGSIINKVGTVSLALSARFRDRPFYVCAESFKIKSTEEFVLEQMSPDELGLQLPGLDTRNYYFERVPAGLITRWVR